VGLLHTFLSSINKLANWLYEKIENIPPKATRKASNLSLSLSLSLQIISISHTLLLHKEITLIPAAFFAFFTFEKLISLPI
jgi:hypothetical protein